MTLKEKFIAEALSRRNSFFNPGVEAQCANFVRDVAKEVGLSFSVTKTPFDGFLPTGEGYANSLAGPEIGNIVTVPSSGDLVFFQNTYGDWPKGTITHVGIVVENGYMVDRSTMDAPVRRRSIETFGANKIWGFVRPHQFVDVNEDKQKIKLFFNKNGFKVVVPQDLKKGEYQVDFLSAEIDI